MRLRLAVAGLLLVGVLALLGGSAGAFPNGEGPSPALAVDPEVSALSSRTTLYILGSGFAPGREVGLLVQSSGGATFPFPSITNITREVKPAPKASDFGNFAVVWSMGAWTTIAGEGVYAVLAVDENYNTLASAPFGACDTAKPGTDWCKAKYPPPTPTPTPRPPAPTPTPTAVAR